MLLYSRLVSSQKSTFSALNASGKSSKRRTNFKRFKHKILDVGDAVKLVKDGDMISCSGFVTHSAPETLLEALGNHYREHGSPKNLTLFFGGGPGDYATRGLNHLGQEGLLKTAIGAHYGQVPKVAELVLQNKIYGYALPLGSISRMLRAAACRSPGHITSIGLGTFVDPRIKGGKLNDMTKETGQDLVKLMDIDGREYLRYIPPSIKVCFIRATTGDPEGNLTMEKEVMYSDAKATAMATRAAGGLVIAEVERIAVYGTIPARSVFIPGTLVDCVVQRKPEHCDMSYTKKFDPSWAGAIRTPSDNFEKKPMDCRKIIAKRASFELKAGQTVNLGIGMPEYVASVAQEEDIFSHVTLTTESGIIGGIAAGGHSFGAGSNYDSMLEMNQMFDLYNGGGLSICFLGMAAVSPKGDVNVSRLTMDSLTGPGGFIDITQSTRTVIFMGSFMKKGLQTTCKDGKLSIDKEGGIKTFSTELNEITFSAEQALAKGQRVLYVTERAVFELNHRGLKLIEIAPGIDIDRDILPNMEFEPYIKDRNTIKTMDERIFSPNLMNLKEDWFSVSHLFKKRLDFNSNTKTAYIDLSNFSVTQEKEIEEIEQMIINLFEKAQKETDQKKFHVVVNYDHFDCKTNLLERWKRLAGKMQSKYYESVVRFSSSLFKRQKLGESLSLQDTEGVWETLTAGSQGLNRTSLREGLENLFHIAPNDEVLDYIMSGQIYIKEEDFPEALRRLNIWRRNHFIPDEEEE
eukprot:TRINITY_DN5101_c0_g1_i1.p1 TRINITY_DN5101_c0_g1~~TRINITY_DN5101_c0_g1_i1.p1  ORF type:complete len:745 (+),score=196.42 TRINITY_DN5101_c0_g1_i1:294-2528(+)